MILYGLCLKKFDKKNGKIIVNGFLLLISFRLCKIFLLSLCVDVENLLFFLI